MNRQLCQELLNNATKVLEYENSNLQNVSYPFSLKIWKDFYFMDYVKILICGIIVIGGSLGNLSVILTVVLNKSMRNNINFYIANLAVADFIICAISMVPQAIKALTVGKFYPLGVFMCKFNPFIKKVCLISSVLTLSSISCDRSMAIMFPLRARITKKRPAIILIVIWIIAILLSVPIIVFKQYHVRKWQNFVQHQCTTEWPYEANYEESVAFCVRHKPLRVIYTIILSITLFFLPVVIMITAYLLILWTLHRTKVPGEQYDGSSSIQSRARKKVNLMVFIVLVIFIICWMPLEVLYLFSVVHSPGKSKQGLSAFPSDLKWILECIAYSNSFFNPIIYGWFNKTFRDGFCNLLRCRCQRRQYRNSDKDKNSRSKNHCNFPSLTESVQSINEAISSLRCRTNTFFSKPNANSSTGQTTDIEETNV